VLSVSNAYGAIVSSNALLTVLVLPPSIAIQPANQAVVAGDTATFTVAAGGTPPWYYQWSFNATNLAGATNAALIITNAQPDQAGNYSVLVANTNGSNQQRHRDPDSISVAAVRRTPGLPAFGQSTGHGRLSRKSLLYLRHFISRRLIQATEIRCQFLHDGSRGGGMVSTFSERFVRV